RVDQRAGGDALSDAAPPRATGMDREPVGGWDDTASARVPDHARRTEGTERSAGGLAKIRLRGDGGAGRRAMTRPESIHEYLSELSRMLTVTPSRRRRVLREIEDHLRESARREVEAGASLEDAERIGIARCGLPVGVVRSVVRGVPVVIGCTALIVTA